MFGAVTGLLIGSAQLLALRGLPRPWRWLIATAIGLGVTHGLGDGLSPGAGYLPVALGGGLVTGSLQAAVLRWPWWLVATAAAFVVGILGGYAIIAAADLPNAVSSDWMLRHAIVAAATGIAYAVFTAPFFAFRQPRVDLSLEESHAH